MSQNAAVKEHLENRFRQDRIVIWNDTEGSFSEDIESLAPEDVVVLTIDNNEFSIKNRVLREEKNARFLIYRSGEMPRGIDNWLLDLELSYGVFTADRGALLQADLGLLMPGAEELIHAHSKFFKNAKLVSKFRNLQRDTDDLVTVQAKMSAVLLKQDMHSFSELMRTLLIEHAQNSVTSYDALTEHGLDESTLR